MLASDGRLYPLSVSDASVIYPVIQARFLEVSEYAQQMGIEPHKIPYFTHLSDVCSKLQSFLESPDDALHLDSLIKSSMIDYIESGHADYYKGFHDALISVSKYLSSL